ncbi:tetratricopeptide repeat protein [Enterovibrio norvegicus]|uniref:tetratricopeptide repeat protein n=1 Tax=Enterovibrio norvegicus TaxID=188144 RepID=UPI00352F2106
MSHHDIDENHVADPPQDDLVSRLKKRVANHPIGASIIIITAVVIALSQAVPPIVSLYEYLTVQTRDTDYLDDENFKIGQREYFHDNDDEAAYVAYLAAANDENPLAQAAIAKFLWRGLIGPKDEDGAKYWATKALPQLNRLVAVDHAEALYTLGWLTNNGVGVAKDEKKAISLYERAAWKGIAWAQTNLGAIYEAGENLPKDAVKAEYFYTLAANQGYVPAQYELALLYKYGDDGVPIDLAAAMNLFSLAANKGDADAQYHLGDMYRFGKGAEIDLEKAVHFYTLSANQEKDSAQWALAYCYSKGLGVEKDPKRAVSLYTLAADQGHSSALNNLSILYRKGEGVAKNLNKAITLLQQAADNGHSSALNNLGWQYEIGEGVPKDLNKAFELYSRSAELKNSSAHVNLGILYRYGDGVEKNAQTAAKHYQLAADQNNAKGQTYLGELYEFGDGVEENAVKAVELYQLAYEQGNQRAQMRLGAAYMYGMGGLDTDEEKAKALLLDAADNNENLANWFLSSLHANKESPLYDDEARIRYLKTAAENGHFCAQNNYGVYLEENSPESAEEAVTWYAKAASQGHQRGLKNFIAQLELGNATESDIALVRDYYLEQAGKQNIHANLILADWHNRGVIVEKDIMKSVSYFFEAKKLGSDEADEKIAAVLAPQHTFAATCPTNI